MPQSLQLLYTLSYQQKIIQEVTKKTWYVHIGERLTNAHRVVRYIGRYTKRPAIAESKILSYDGKTVIFTYKEHRMTHAATITLSSLAFIKRLIVHIPDVNFRIIRYFGFYANRLRGELLPKVFAIRSQDYAKAKEKLTHLSSWWRERIARFTRLDPLICDICFIPLELVSVVYSTGYDPGAFGTSNTYG